MRTHNLTRAGIVATVAAALITIPTAALADEGTVWEAWIMPNDGTDWPQQIASDANLAALPCGTTWRIQNDEYLPAERDRFAADGVLNYGEDFGSETQRGAISWYLEPTPEPTDTPVPQPAPTAVPQAVEADAAGAPSALAASATTLAETGPEEDATIRLIIGAVVLVIAGTALTIGRRKQGNR